MVQGLGAGLGGTVQGRGAGLGEMVQDVGAGLGAMVQDEEAGPGGMVQSMGAGLDKTKKETNGYKNLQVETRAGGWGGRDDRGGGERGRCNRTHHDGC